MCYHFADDQGSAVGNSPGPANVIAAANAAAEPASFIALEPAPLRKAAANECWETLAVMA